jgi:hypothetical protein
VTIGIAAAGPGAGLAVWRALRAVELVGRGAIGGFVSLAAIGADGRLRRAEIQRGGAAALFGRDAADAVPDEIAAAPLAGLMSSGPDRPEPLAQFVPADGAVGLVTGHRLPNVAGASGLPVNEEVLRLMREGRPPRAAVLSVLGRNPDADAGVIALDRRGRLFAADAPPVLARGDRGAALRRLRPGGPAAAALHNAVLPHRPLAALAVETALDAMEPADLATGTVLLEAGTPLALGPAPAYLVDRAGRAVTRILVADPRYLEGAWGLGLGHAVEVRGEGDGRPLGRAVYEPYMLVAGGRLRSADGAGSLPIPLRP